MRPRYPSEPVLRWVAGILGPTGQAETLDFLRSVTLATREQFSHRRRIERGTQPPHETLALGTGSCRDFALFMMEAVRAVDLAARFVSGYIFTPDTEHHSVGGGATHAWLQSICRGRLG